MSDSQLCAGRRSLLSNALDFGMNAHREAEGLDI
jgi:hypothetical protein